MSISAQACEITRATTSTASPSAEVGTYSEQLRDLDIVTPEIEDSLATLANMDPTFKVRPEIETQAVRLVLANRKVEESCNPSFTLLPPVEQRAAGLVEASKVLGHDLSLYDNLIMGGRLHLLYELRHAPTSVLEYVTTLERRLNPTVKAFMRSHSYRLDSLVRKYNWINYRYDFGSANTLTGIYLLKPHIDLYIAETPALMYLRVSVQIYARDGIAAVESCFDDLAMARYIPATPTLLNAGTKKPQMSSCFLLSVDDSLQSMYGTNYNMAMLSAANGGLGIDVSEIRHSEIDEVGRSSGVVPLLCVYDKTLAHVDQGGGKRKGAASTFMRPHHIDICEYISLVDPVGDPNARAHGLNPAIWTSWLFWERVRNDGDWTLFCPAKVPQLKRVYGRNFEKLYVEAEANPEVARGYRRTLKARSLKDQITRMMRIAGRPFIMSGDSCNFKSPHKHLGYIRSSNLCVTGSTPLLTSQGYVAIGDYVGKEVLVWNGSNWSATTVELTGDGYPRPILSVYFSDGSRLDCTHNHEFLVLTGDVELEEGEIPETTTTGGQKSLLSGTRRVMAVDLQVGTELYDCQLPVVDVEVESTFPHPYTHAVYCIMGRELLVEDEAEIPPEESTTEEDTRTLYETRVVRCIELSGSRAHIRHHLELEGSNLPSDLPPIDSIPLRQPRTTRLEWLGGLLDAGGHVGTNGSVILHSVRRDFLMGVRLLCNTLGVRADIEEAEMDHSLTLYGRDVIRLISMGMPVRVLPFTYTDFASPPPLTVRAVVNHGICERTFCVKESENHAAVFNGILTGQCLEIIEYTDESTINVCNLCSISMPSVARDTYDEPPTSLPEAISRVDFDELSRLARTCVRNLNRVIDNNYYPLMNGDAKGSSSIDRTNKSHRAIGLGVQGLAELFHRIDVPYVSEWASKLDEMIFAAIYYNSLASSVQLAITEGICDIFAGSPYSEGHLQFDLWSQEHELRWGRHGHSPSKMRRYEDTLPLPASSWGQKSVVLHDTNGIEIDEIQPNWDDLRRCVVRYGLHNSLLTTQMPTASTSRLLRNSEATEAHIRNIYSAKVISGNFAFVNAWMVRDLESIGLWNCQVKDYIVANDGVLTGLGTRIRERPNEYPGLQEIATRHAERLQHLETKYRTMWEVPQREVLIRAANRGKYLDQSQSMSLFMVDATNEKLTAALLMGDSLSLKTGCYYVRTQSARGAGQLTTQGATSRATEEGATSRTTMEKREGQYAGPGPLVTPLLAKVATYPVVPPLGKSLTGEMGRSEKLQLIARRNETAEMRRVREMAGRVGTNTCDGDICTSCSG